MSFTRSKNDIKSGGGLIANLINFDVKNKNCPLKQNVPVKRIGGLFLSDHGVKVGIPPYASTGRRERILCGAFPSTARGVIGPWLGPDMRMASEVHMLYSPVKFRMPVAVFIPFSFAATREMYHPSGSINIPFESLKRPDSKSSLHNGIQSSKTSARLRGKPPYLMHFGDHLSTVPSLINARSVSLLQCRLGDDCWHVVKEFTIVQPTIPYVDWPLEACELTLQTSRWSVNSTTSENSSSLPIKLGQLLLKKSNLDSARVKQNYNRSEDEKLPYDFANKIENYCGGVYIYTEELNHCYMLVNSTKAEQFCISPNGGFFLSPLLDPFLSVRIPKRVCPTFEQTIFKKIEIRNTWLNSAYQFDSQFNEIEGCSNIFEFQLQDTELKRPATIHLPLPQWYIDKFNKSLDSLEQTNINVNVIEMDSLPGVPAYHVKNSNVKLSNEDRRLFLLFQPSGYIKQIVWQSAKVKEINEEEIFKTKLFENVDCMESLNFSKCKIDNIFIQLGWPYLLVGIRGGLWKTMKQSVYYTKRTISFDTTVLGRFVLIGVQHSDRKTSDKLEHLMTQIESLAYAPPGAILICLHLTANNWQIMANVYPEERLEEVIEKLISNGFIPLVQVCTGVVRKAIGLNNAILQTIEYNRNVKNEKANRIKYYRITGYDINHILMLNGLCLELRFNGDIQIKPTSQFDPYTKCIHSKQKDLLINNSTSSELITLEKNETFELSDINFDLDIKLNKQTDQIKDEIKPEKLSHTELLSKHARIQLHELMSDTSCIVEIEPMESLEEKYSERSAIKLQYLTELLNKPTPQDPSYQNEDEPNDNVDEFIEDSVPENEDTMKTLENNKKLNVTTAENKSLKDQTYSPTIINQDLFNRFETILENSEIRRSSEFIMKIYELYHVGTVEIWLVPPYDMPQLEVKGDNEPQEKQPETKNHLSVSAHKPDVRSVSNYENVRPHTNKEFTPPTSPKARPKSSFPQTRQPKAIPDDSVGSYKNQKLHVIRLNTVCGIEIAKEKSPSGVIMEDFPWDLKSPLATYDIMIDPDIVSNYLRVKSFKSKNLNSTGIPNDGLGKSARISSTMVPKEINRSQSGLNSSVGRNLSNLRSINRGIISARSLNANAPRKKTG
ncbi:unnamed protein product [Schistosoma rodhaini]|uniref:Uncharacterized protein n=1 Tax=Schistosoma rodhaini TaxID=6188 RepID=A0AA85F687_9TREM|nr:unnamed protein product [Schistosoma rodhaini]